MKKVDIFVWVIIVGNIVLSGWFAAFGVIKWKAGNRNFNWRELFQGKSIDNSSGPLLLVEAGVIFIFGLLLLCVYRRYL